MDVGSTPDLRTWILSFGSGAEVLEPDGLRSEVARELQGALGRYQSAKPGDEITSSTQSSIA
jgi:predicted DNA-binding transcriptional regulator YafY